MEEKRSKWLIGLVGTVFVLLCVLVWVNPVKEYSVSERRLLKQMPELSVETILSGRFMSSFEAYSLDQFPCRDLFRRFKAMTLLQLDNNDLYVVEDRIDGENVKVIGSMDYPLGEESFRYAGKRFRNVYDLYLKDNNCAVYLSIIPDKNYFYAKNNGYLSMDYEQLVNIMLGESDYMTYINIFPHLSGEDYYRTDIHWRQENIADVADYLLKEMGQDAKSQYNTIEVDEDFYGVYYGQAALPIEPDAMKYLTNDVIEQLKVYDYQNNKEIPVYNKETSEDLYEIYLGGPISLATIDNPACDNGKHLIVFRDSFGSSIAPMLAQGYSKTTLIDIRYILPNLLGEYVDFQDADVLFLYSTPVLNNSGIIK